MQNGLLPEEYSRTIITGVWDNTEILPPIETGLQGFGIHKCLTKNILEGTWTEELGASEFIGTENCFRVLTTNEIVN